MRIEPSMHTGWLSNAYLIFQGERGVIIDTGADMEPLLRLAERHGVAITHVFCTHRHGDHVQNNAAVRKATGAVLVAHAADAGAIGGIDLQVGHGEIVETGDLSIEVLHIPGHTAGQIALLVNDTDLFTGDTLFRRSIGGCIGPGHTSFQDLRRSLMEVLMALPHDLRVHPGHSEATTLGDEWRDNPFIRIMRRCDPEGAERCSFAGSDATLILRATDYDGGTKAWVRLRDTGDLVVPGSMVD